MVNNNIECHYCLSFSNLLCFNPFIIAQRLNKSKIILIFLPNKAILFNWNSINKLCQVWFCNNIFFYWILLIFCQCSYFWEPTLNKSNKFISVVIHLRILSLSFYQIKMFFESFKVSLWFLSQSYYFSLFLGKTLSPFTLFNKIDPALIKIWLLQRCQIKKKSFWLKTNTSFDC